MPRKVRELENQLAQAGFKKRPGKGSHRVWEHPSGVRTTVSGKEGRDAKDYQEKDVEKALRKAQG